MSSTNFTSDVIESVYRVGESKEITFRSSGAKTSTRRIVKEPKDMAEGDQLCKWLNNERKDFLAESKFSELPNIPEIIICDLTAILDKVRELQEITVVETRAKKKNRKVILTDEP